LVDRIFGYNVAWTKGIAESSLKAYRKEGHPFDIWIYVLRMSDTNVCFNLCSSASMMKYWNYFHV